MRKAAIALTVGAVACGAAASYIRFVMIPDAEQVRSDTHTVNRYAGTASFLDNQAIAAGDFPHAFQKDVPFTAVEDFKTASLHDGTAVITDATTVSGPAAPALSNTTVNWAVDRKTLLPAAAPAGSDAVDHKGLAVGFPFDPGAHDYPWWDVGSGKQATAKYVRTEKHMGRTAYVYTVDASGTLADKTILAKVPPSIQADVLKGLAASVVPDQASTLALLLPKNGGEVPLAYASTTKTTLWVDKFDGTTLDVDVQQTVMAQLKSALGMVPLAPVLDVHTKYSPQGVAESVQQSKDNQSQMLWEGEVAPGALAALALVLLIGAVVVWRRGGAAAAPTGDSAAGETAAEDEPSPDETTA
ncbi:MAG: porin PorA family protein [Catenulispora sp.]